MNRASRATAIPGLSLSRVTRWGVLAPRRKMARLEKSLGTLFENSFPGVPVYGTREDTEIAWPFNHNAEYRLSMGSLGKFYRNKVEDFPGTPYLKSETAPRGEKLSLEFDVGINGRRKVEVAGIEPASEPGQTKATTRLVPLCSSYL